MPDDAQSKSRLLVYVVVAVVAVVSLYFPLRSISSTFKDYLTLMQEEGAGEVGEQPPYFARLRFLNGGKKKVIEPTLTLDPPGNPVTLPDNIQAGQGWITAEGWTTDIFKKATIAFEIATVGTREIEVSWPGGLMMGNVEIIVTIDENHNARAWSVWGQTWNAAPPPEGWHVATQYHKDP